MFLIKTFFTFDVTVSLKLCLIASLLRRESKPGMYYNAGAIKYSKGRKITAPPNECHNIPLLIKLSWPNLLAASN